MDQDDTGRGGWAGRPGRDRVSFALAGAGSVGRGVFHQSTLTPGVRCDVVCDVEIERALALAGPRRPAKVVSTPGALADAVAGGALAVCEDAMLAANAPGVDVLFDASTAIDAAPAFVEAAMRSGKHVVMMNAEADLLFGPLFWRTARREGVGYTSCDGDQPVAIARLVEELRFYGMELVMAGNIKGYLDRYTDPVAIKPEADKRYLDPQMCSSYTDGTKLCVEMALVANGLGARVSRPGMTGPRMDQVFELFDQFDLQGAWSPGEPPLVDYVLGARPKGGVFAVGHVDDAYQRKMLDWFPSELGPGPFYVLNRPHHLIHLETMRTVLEVASGRSILAPRFGRCAEVVCYAKGALAAGEALDGPGGFACYGLIETLDGTADAGLPICLSHGVRLRRPVAPDGRIGWGDVDEATVPPAALKAYREAGRASLQPAV